MNAALFTRRWFGVFLLAALGSVSVADTPSLSRREMLVEAIDANKKSVTFREEPGAQRTKAKPFACTLLFTDECIFRQRANGGRVKASFADLKVGQRALVSGVLSRGFTGGDFATKIIILPAKTK